ncbi:MAG: hypothetical protein WED07_16110 [Candidatus Freyarchaeum deiterrae]
MDGICISYRRGGVTALAVLFLFIGAYGGIGATLAGFSLGPTIFQPMNIWQIVLVLFMFTVAEMYVFAAFGLLHMKRWGRYLALILGVGMIPWILGIAIVVYLMRDVKYDFE